jgi:hypothetical protein
MHEPTSGLSRMEAGTPTLGELNKLLASVGAPALSALVFLQETKEPGDGFWDCAPNVPHRPKKDIDRLTEWSHIVTAIGNYNWPTKLPSKLSNEAHNPIWEQGKAEADYP